MKLVLYPYKCNKYVSNNVMINGPYKSTIMLSLKIHLREDRMGASIFNTILYESLHSNLSIFLPLLRITELCWQHFYLHPLSQLHVHRGPKIVLADGNMKTVKTWKGKARSL